MTKQTKTKKGAAAVRERTAGASEDQNGHIMYAQSAARLLQILDIMRTRVGTAGYPIDEEAAKRVVAYLLDRAGGKSESRFGREVEPFLASIGISIDWTFCGDIAALVVDAVRYGRERDAVAR